jgi:hypothetical protein
MEIKNVVVKNRTFALVGEKQYQRKDGTWTTLKVWRSDCAVCGAGFEVATPSAVTDASGSKAFGAQHCALHRLTPAQTKQRWLEGLKKQRGVQNGRAL